MFDFSGQVALVTGSSRGIGLAAARALGCQGATVVLNARNAARLDEAGSRLRDEGIAVHTACFDVADIDTAIASIEQARQDLGKIDVFFANAGIQHREPLLSFPLETFERIVFANLTAQWALARHIASSMVAQAYGRIVFTGSVTALLGRRDVTAYTAAKAAMHGLVRQWSTEFADTGVTVNAIAPGYIKTELTQNLWNDPSFNTWLQGRAPQKRWGAPDDIASAVVFLAARESQFVTGQILAVDGGLSSTM